MNRRMIGKHIRQGNQGFRRQQVALTLLLVSFSSAANAQFSTDAPILLKMLANNVSQLYQLYEVVQTSRERLELMKELSNGFDTAMQRYSMLAPPEEPGQYKKWRNVGQVLRQLEKTYGSTAQTPDAKVQREIDLGVAEAIHLKNSAYKYIDRADALGKRIQSRSNLTNAKGAQRLTAQSIGVLIEAQNLASRIEAAQLKLSAQALAMENRKAKQYASRVQKDNKDLSRALRHVRTTFSTPRL